MSTIATTATIPLVVNLTDPLHHGAGTAGNTSLLRTQDIVLPDGRAARVPFVSGNSLRHQIRAALAWHLIHTLDLPDGSLPKPVVDLLWSGGALTGPGAQIDLDQVRQVEEHAPWLRLLGYSAGNNVVAGTLHVDNLHLACHENAWRLPAELARSAHAEKGAAAYRGDEFGTRHDVEGTAVDRYVDTAGAIIGGKTTQMIYDLQVLRAGAVLSGGLTLDASATPVHRTALAAAVNLIAPIHGTHRRIRLGAKTAVGYGGGILTADLSPIDPDGTALDRWTTHLHDHHSHILDLLGALTA